MMALQPAQLHETVALMAADRAEMVEALAIALAIESDGSLQTQLRKLARARDGQPFMVRPLRSPAWLRLGNDPRVTVHRERLDGLATVDLALVRASNPGLTDALKRALSRTALGSAFRLLDPVWDMKDMPSREQYAVLHRWSHLLEQLAYKSGTRLSILLDLLRSEIRRNLAEGENVGPQLYTYWSALHVMANLIMLASDAQSRAWLNDMASQLSWTMWTPTFPLLRERTVWLAACAARSAVAFGEPVIGQYLATLSKAEHPMKAFDALFGLVAIALDRKDSAAAILSEIRSLKQAFVHDRHASHADYFRMECDDAMRTILEAGAGQQTSLEMRELGWGFQSGVGFATRAALSTDPASFSASGRFVGFSILPVVVSAAPEEHYCTTAIRWSDLDVSGEDIASIFRKAWVPNSLEAASHILQ
jgi:hypothetical protein